MCKSWFNLKLKPFIEESNRWYNLSTGRFINRAPKSGNIEWSIRGIRVIGTLDQIKKFHEVNNLEENYEKLRFKPFGDIAFVSNDACRMSINCQLGPCSEHLPVPESCDVETLTQEQINNLGTFGFGGLFTKALVTNVIDGDTITVVVFAPLEKLGTVRKVSGRTKANIYPSSEDSGFFTTLNIRIFGYDAVEKDQPDGKLAKEIMSDKIKSLNNIIWCQFLDPSIGVDKYNRHLAILYEDSDRKILLNDYLYTKQNEHGKKLVNPYLGGTKQKFN